MNVRQKDIVSWDSDGRQDDAVSQQNPAAG
jgi:hypothetical protein